jgi:hypothetical protein
MYISSGHGHLSPEHDTSQHLVKSRTGQQRTSREKKFVVLMELHRAIIYTTEMSKQVTECHVRDAVHMYPVNRGAGLTHLTAHFVSCSQRLTCIVVVLATRAGEHEAANLRALVG